MYNQSLPGTSMQQHCNLNAGIQIPAHIKPVRHFSKAVKKAISEGMFDTVKHQLMAARYNNLPLISTNQRRNCPDFIETLTESTVKLRQDINSKDCDGNTALMRAAIAGNTDYINMLLKAGADTEVQNKDGYTVLMIAADKGHTDCIKALTENADKSKFDIDNRGYDGNTALMVACLAAKTECITALAKAGADPEIKNRDGYTALVIAADINNTDDIKALKENTTTNTKLTQNNLGISLIRAVGANSTDCVNALLEAGANPNFQNKSGTTALFMAIKEGHIELIEVLRKAGANLNLKTKGGHTALTAAAQIGSVDCLKAIIKIFELRSHHLGCALITASKVNNTGCISLLLEAGVNPNFQNEFDTTALFMAIKGGHIELIEVLKKAGANLNFEAKSGYTALTVAAQIGNSDCLKAVIDNIDELRSNHLDCALIIATKANNAGCISLLLKAGANPNFQAQLDSTALTVAAQIGNADYLKAVIENIVELRSNHLGCALITATKVNNAGCISLLLEAGANPNFQTSLGFTALMIAIDMGDIDCTKVLLRADTNPEIRNNAGNTPLMIATKKQSLKCMDAILDHYSYGIKPEHLSEALRIKTSPECEKRLQMLLPKRKRYQ